MKKPAKHNINMEGQRIFDLKDPKDIKHLNNLTGFAGIHFEKNLLEVYVRIDLDRYRVFSRRKAGRRTLITSQLRQRVYSLHYNKASLREIAKETDISTATVRQILKDYENEEETEQIKLDL